MSARLPLAVIVLLLVGGVAAAAPGAGADPGPPRLGIQVQEMTPELRAWLQAPEAAGVLVARVEPDSPAQEAGVQVGDVIVEAGGEAVETPRDLVWQALRAPEGEPLKLVVLRKGRRVEIAVVPRGRPQPPFWERDDLWGPGQAPLIRDLREHLRTLERRLEKLERKLEEDDVDRTAF
jgi:membrane-associated protease RseP (regulator of RpoE activity)